MINNMTEMYSRQRHSTGQITHHFKRGREKCIGHKKPNRFVNQ